MPKPQPLTPPATPIAIQKSHLLSPPPDRLTNTPTTLSITKESHALTVHWLRAHEPFDSPKRELLYTVLEKQWPVGTWVICAQNVPVLVLRRAWLSGARRWGVRLPDEGKGKEREKVDLLNASMPLAGDLNLKLGVRGGSWLDVRFRNALALTTCRFGERERERRSTVSESTLGDEPPPYSAVAGDLEDEDEKITVQRNEKGNLFSDSNSGNASYREQPQNQNPEVKTSQPDSASILPSYASARLSSSNTLRDLLDAIEPPQDPAPAPEPEPASASASSFQPSSSSSNSSPSSGQEKANTDLGSKIELKAVQLASSGTSVMLGNQRIMHITRHNAMDYSKSKSKLKPRWEAEVAEGVDLLLVSFCL